MDHSGLTVAQSTAEMREEKLHRLRQLYALFALQLALILAGAGALACGLGLSPARLLVPAVGGGGLCAAALLLVYFLPMVRSPPINWALYALFTAGFSLVAAWACSGDAGCLLHFALWVLLGAATAQAGFFLVCAFYPSSLTGALLTLGGATVPLAGFAVLGEAEPAETAVAFLVAGVFAFYTSYQHRAAVRNCTWDFEREEPVSGAVRLWADGLLGFCRTAELFCRPLGAAA